MLRCARAAHRCSSSPAEFGDASWVDGLDFATRSMPKHSDVHNDTASCSIFCMAHWAPFPAGCCILSHGASQAGSWQVLIDSTRSRIVFLARLHRPTRRAPLPPRTAQEHPLTSPRVRVIFHVLHFAATPARASPEHIRSSPTRLEAPVHRGTNLISSHRPLTLWAYKGNLRRGVR